MGTDGCASTGRFSRGRTDRSRGFARVVVVTVPSLPDRPHTRGRREKQTTSRRRTTYPAGMEARMERDIFLQSLVRGYVVGARDRSEDWNGNVSRICGHECPPGGGAQSLNPDSSWFSFFIADNFITARSVTRRLGGGRCTDGMDG